MNSKSEFQSIYDLNNTILAKCIDKSTVHVKFVDSTPCMRRVYSLLRNSFNHF